MSKKGKRASIIASAVLGAGLAIGAATTGVLIANQPLDITYYANNGTPAVSAQIKKGNNLNLPTPTRAGYNFAGWYADTGLTEQITSTKQLKQNSKLYAGWELANYELASINAIDTQAETTGLKSIGKYAFAGSSITTITIPDTVTSIGEGAFQNCTSLTSVKLGKGLKNLSSSAFNGCSNLQYNLFANGKYLGTEENPYWALIKVVEESISSCAIHEGCEYIGQNAFSNCTNLQILALEGENLKVANENMLSDCNALEVIFITDSSLINNYKTATYWQNYKNIVYYYDENDAWIKSDSEHRYYFRNVEHLYYLQTVGEHTFGGWIVDTEARVGVAGSKHRECAVCGYTEASVIPALSLPGGGLIVPGQ